MKRLFILILAISMLLSIVACSETADTSADYDVDTTKSTDKTQSTHSTHSTHSTAPEPDAWVTVYVLTESREYDDNGDLSKFGTREFCYDDMAQLTFDGCWNYEYDKYGSLVKQNDDFRNYSYSWKYNKNGQPASCVSGYRTIEKEYFFEFDNAGSLTGIYYQDAGEKNYTNRFFYDQQGRLSKSQFRSGQRVHEWMYDYHGNLLSRIEYAIISLPEDCNGLDWNGDRILVSYATFSYDENGRLIQYLEYLKGAQLLLKNDRTFTYNKDGSISLCVNNSNGSNDIVTYICDENGNIIEAQYANGRRTEYTYEARYVTPQQAAAYHSRTYYDFYQYSCGSTTALMTLQNGWAEPGYCNLINYPVSFLPNYQLLLQYRLYM